MRVALLVVLSVGCAQSEIPDDYSAGGDTGVQTPADTGAPKTDSGTAPDTTVEDTGSATPDAETVDSGAPSDAEFPDFGGGTDGGMFPEGGFGMCAMDGDCKSPFNCCEPTKMTCGVKFGAGACMTF